MSLSRDTISYVQEHLQGKIESLEAENTRLQAENARLRAQIQAELLDNSDEDSQPHTDLSDSDKRHLRRFRGSDRQAHPPKRPRTETRASIDISRDRQIDSINNGQLESEEEMDQEITVWINQDGRLETDSQVDVQAWSELEEIWADQELAFTSKDPNWASVNLKNKWAQDRIVPTSAELDES